MGYFKSRCGVPGHNDRDLAGLLFKRSKDYFSFNFTAFLIYLLVYLLVYLLLLNLLTCLLTLLTCLIPRPLKMYSTGGLPIVQRLVCTCLSLT